MAFSTPTYTYHKTIFLVGIPATAITQRDTQTVTQRDGTQVTNQRP
jgi:hypothetical protein